MHNNESQFQQTGRSEAMFIIRGTTVTRPPPASDLGGGASDTRLLPGLTERVTTPLKQTLFVENRVWMLGGRLTSRLLSCPNWNIRSPDYNLKNLAPRIFRDDCFASFPVEKEPLLDGYEVNETFALRITLDETAITFLNKYFNEERKLNSAGPATLEWTCIKSQIVLLDIGQLSITNYFRVRGLSKENIKSLESVGDQCIAPAITNLWSHFFEPLVNLLSRTGRVALSESYPWGVPSILCLPNPKPTDFMRPLHTFRDTFSYRHVIFLWGVNACDLEGLTSAKAMTVTSFADRFSGMVGWSTTVWTSPALPSNGLIDADITDIINIDTLSLLHSNLRTATMSAYTAILDRIAVISDYDGGMRSWIGARIKALRIGVNKKDICRVLLRDKDLSPVRKITPGHLRPIVSLTKAHCFLISQRERALSEERRILYNTIITAVERVSDISKLFGESEESVQQAIQSMETARVSKAARIIEFVVVVLGLLGIYSVLTAIAEMQQQPKLDSLKALLYSPISISNGMDANEFVLLTLALIVLASIYLLIQHSRKG